MEFGIVHDKSKKMKKFLIVLFVFMTSFDLMSQVYGFDLEERYDSIPAKEWNRKFIAMLDVQFDSLVKKGVDSIMLYYCASRFTSFAFLTFKDSKQNCTIAYYEYSPEFSRLGWEILSPSIIDSINILNHYFLFKNNETKTVPPWLGTTDAPPTFGKFYIGKSTEVYGIFTIMLDEQIEKEKIQEMYRIMVREKQILINKYK
jgi:hypothetical protein